MVISGWCLAGTSELLKIILVDWIKQMAEHTLKNEKHVGENMQVFPFAWNWLVFVAPQVMGQAIPV